MKALFTPLFVFCVAAFGVPDASEWTKPRNFHTPFEEDFEDKIEVSERANGVPPELITLSANQAYWFYVEPYNEEVFEQRIVISGERVLTINLKDAYASFPFRVEWINEKLIFIRVWWDASLART